MNAEEPQDQKGVGEPTVNQKFERYSQGFRAYLGEMMGRSLGPEVMELENLGYGAVVDRDLFDEVAQKFGAIVNGSGRGIWYSLKVPEECGSIRVIALFGGQN